MAFLVTQTVVSSSLNPSMFGDGVVFTILVTTDAVADKVTVPITGSATFLDGGTSLGTVSFAQSSAATFIPQSLTVGTHTITVVYSGDLNYLPSTATVLLQVVNQLQLPTPTPEPSPPPMPDPVLNPGIFEVWSALEYNGGFASYQSPPPASFTLNIAVSMANFKGPYPGLFIAPSTLDDTAQIDLASFSGGVGLVRVHNLSQTVVVDLGLSIATLPGAPYIPLFELQPGEFYIFEMWELVLTEQSGVKVFLYGNGGSAPVLFEAFSQ